MNFSPAPIIDASNQADRCSIFLGVSYSNSSVASAAVMIGAGARIARLRRHRLLRIRLRLCLDGWAGSRWSGGLNSGRGWVTRSASGGAGGSSMQTLVESFESQRPPTLSLGSCAAGHAALMAVVREGIVASRG